MKKMDQQIVRTDNKTLHMYGISVWYCHGLSNPSIRLYSTFNRIIRKIDQPVRLIETVLIIETTEYLHYVSRC